MGHLLNAEELRFFDREELYEVLGICARSSPKMKILINEGRRKICIDRIKKLDILHVLKPTTIHPKLDFTIGK